MLFFLSENGTLQSDRSTTFTDKGYTPSLKHTLVSFNYSVSLFSLIYTHTFIYASCINIMVLFILTFSSALLLVTVLLSCLTGSLSFVFLSFIFSAFHFPSYFLCSFSFLLPPCSCFFLTLYLSLFLFQSLTPHNPSHSVSLYLSLVLFLSLSSPAIPLLFPLTLFMSLFIFLPFLLFLPPSPPFILLFHISSINPHSPV